MSPTFTLAQLTEENNHPPRATVEDQAAELYNERHAHKGKDFTDVGKKQQHRHNANKVSPLLMNPLLLLR